MRTSCLIDRCSQHSRSAHGAAQTPPPRRFLRRCIAMLFVGLAVAVGCGRAEEKIRAPSNPQPLPTPTIGGEAQYQAPADVELTLPESRNVAD